MLWPWHTKDEPTELGYDPDRVVQLTVGQLTDAIAEALKVVSDAPSAPLAEPKWKRGDRAYVEVEVTGGSDNNVNTVVVGMSGNGRSLNVPSVVLMEAT